MPSNRLTWKCTDPGRKTAFLLERGFVLVGGRVYVCATHWQTVALVGLGVHFLPRLCSQWSQESVGSGPTAHAFKRKSKPIPCQQNMAITISDLLIFRIFGGFYVHGHLISARRQSVATSRVFDRATCRARPRRTTLVSQGRLRPRRNSEGARKKGAAGGFIGAICMSLLLPEAVKDFLRGFII